MKRREFIQNSSIGLGALFTMPSPLYSSSDAGLIRSELPKFRVRRLTHGPKHHFFGYYDMSPWNRDESKLVCLESEFQHRLPNPGETANIGFVAPDTGDFT
ncbi:MAG: hypothetical protein OEX02_07700, partial [Cyclobacteriaceae bacterium]|nr:hypothetical protein [Cyclobacteriaceae bacterium]